jgi:hypothetical protein
MRRRCRCGQAYGWLCTRRPCRWSVGVFDPAMHDHPSHHRGCAVGEKNRPDDVTYESRTVAYKRGVQAILEAAPTTIGLPGVVPTGGRYVKLRSAGPQQWGVHSATQFSSRTNSFPKAREAASQAGFRPIERRDRLQEVAGLSPASSMKIEPYKLGPFGLVGPVENSLRRSGMTLGRGHFRRFT